MPAPSSRSADLPDRVGRPRPRLGGTGPLFGFSDTWQLFINTTTTVITFWMVLVIQNSADRQGKATQLKLDELIRVVANARNEFVSLDHESEEVLADHEHEFEALVARAARSLGDIATEPIARPADG